MPAKPRKSESHKDDGPMSGLPELPDPNEPPGEIPPRNPDGEATKADAERALEAYRSSSPTGIPVEGEADRHATKEED